MKRIHWTNTERGPSRAGGVPPDDRPARLSKFFLSLIAAITLIFGFINLVFFDYAVLATIEFAVCLVVLAALTDLHINHNVTRASWVTICSSGGLALFYYWYVHAGLAAPVWLVFFMMGNFFLLGTRRAVPVSLAFAGCVAALIILHRDDWLSLQPEAALVNIFGALIASGTAAYYQERSRERAHDRAQQLANEDSLTGVSNRRHFIAQFSDISGALTSQNRTYSLLLADIDEFKRINDSHGHACGDEVITIISQRVVSAVRTHDLVGRLGGEEFGVLLLDCDEGDARQRAETIRQAVASTPIAVGGERIQVTISIGVAHARQEVRDFNALFIEADERLYLAKGQGRDRVIAEATPA